MSVTERGANRGDGGAKPAPNRLECRGVTVRFGGLVAVRDVDLEVPPATIVGLVGPNGAGKSTLFGVVSGLLRPTSGRVLLEGDDVTGTRPQVRADRGLARTFQHPEIFGGLTVRQHLTLAHRVRNSRSRVWTDLFTMGSLHPVNAEEKARVDELIGLLGLTPIADSPALGLPLGSSRLVEVGRALATSPTVLLLDEPSSGLDSTETEQFEQTLRRVADEQGISVLLVEHDVELVMRLCASIYVLDFGALIAHGTPEEVRANPAVRAAYLGEELAPTQPGRAGDGGESPLAPTPATDGEMNDVVTEEAAPSDDVPAAPRRDGADLVGVSPPATAGPSGSLALAVEGLSVSYGEAMALTDISFRVDAGKVLAVLGSNGAGKSSLARAISGLVQAQDGRVLFGDEDVRAWTPDRIRRAGLLHLPEGRGVFRSLTVIDNVKMAAASVDGGRKARREAVAIAFDTFPVLASRRRQVAGSLSGGEQQMLSLARALATAPKLIVADEMSLGLAPRLVDLVFDGLARARDRGVTVVMIEQYVHRALAFADDCLVLQRGALAWHGPARQAGGEVLSRYLGEAMTAAS
ncbi:MAG TPA: ATP-binding cassette domain-containing protein [Acidimicrobiales bacterium]|nr:ATP-binding cassette domain-containing protein [Acidimicrobiales bacterium]